VPDNGYTDAELAAMMVDLESDLVERKRSLSTSASEKISRSICALANDLPGHGRPGVMHRSYEGTNAPTRLYWFADRVWIESPGGLYGRVTRETLLKGATDYRNGLIAEVMRNLGFAQHFGLGIPLAREALAANSNPEPEFDVQHTWVRATIRPSRSAR